MSSARSRALMHSRQRSRPGDAISTFDGQESPGDVEGRQQTDRKGRGCVSVVGSMVDHGQRNTGADHIEA